MDNVASARDAQQVAIQKQLETYGALRIESQRYWDHDAQAAVANIERMAANDPVMGTADAHLSTQLLARTRALIGTLQ